MVERYACAYPSGPWTSEASQPRSSRQYASDQRRQALGPAWARVSTSVTGVLSNASDESSNIPGGFVLRARSAAGAEGGVPEVTEALEPAAYRRRAVRRTPQTVQAEVRRLLVGLATIECMLLCLSLVLAWNLRMQLGLWNFAVRPEHISIWLAGGLVIFWFGMLTIKGAYSARLFGGGPEEYKVVAMSSVSTVGTIAITCYLFRYDFSRGFLILAFTFGTGLLIVERYAVGKFVRELRCNGRLRHRVVAVGTASAVDELIDVFERERYLGYEIVGMCVPKHAQSEDLAWRVPLLGSPEDVKVACEENGADTVLVAGGSFSSAADLRKVGWQLERSDIDLIVVPSLAEVAGPRIHLRPVAGLPLMHVEPPQADAAGRWSKRLFDVMGASILLSFLAPVMLLIAAVIKANDGGSVLFRQARVGRNGEIFDCFKFRSMCVDAEQRLAALEHLNESDGVLFKMRADPRTTRVGRVLRRFSLDELPQLINVVDGSMSLVGPRPPLQSEVDVYGSDVHRRLLVRPGMTGLWQVSGRSELSWRESVRLDLYYVDNWSMMGDLVILAKTLRAVIASRGAY
jgi:exopolysaccharide biosynthesis polyprenyl glycosylphosphotransferase